MATDFASTPLTSEQQMNVFRLRDKMSLLNAEFLQVLNGFYTEKNHYDFTVTMQSYMEHVKNLKVMYKVDDDVAAAMTVTSVPTSAIPKRMETKSAISGESPFQRKIAKATRRNGTPNNASTDSPKIVNSTVFAASSPATAISAPKFGDISVISKETPAPLGKVPETLEPSAPATARKRAIRGGGPLGGSESVIFKSGNEPQASTSTVNIPTTNIKFPEPSKDFWTKKDTNTTDAPNNGGSLFAFLGKDGDKSKEPTKFSGFSFGKQAVGGNEKPAEAGTSLFATKNETSTTAKPSTGSPFGGITKVPSPTAATASLSKPLTFGEVKKDSSESATGTAPKPFSALSFGASLFGSSSGSTSGTAAPTLSFGSGTSLASGSFFGGFAGLAQKAMDNQAKPEGGDDEEAEYVPPKAETVEAEEPDAVLSSKVSVFKHNGKEYMKLGVGMLHVKDTDGKLSVLIRAATATGTVWLNALCNKTMKATKIDEKGDRVRLTCPTSQNEMTTMAIRFGTAEGAKKFTDKIDEAAK